jgi:hypothetical protein
MHVRGTERKGATAFGFRKSFPRRWAHDPHGSGEVLPEGNVEALPEALPEVVPEVVPGGKASENFQKNSGSPIALPSGMAAAPSRPRPI